MKVWKDDLYCVVADDHVYLLYEKTPNHAMANVLESIGRNFQVSNIHVHMVSIVKDERLDIPLKTK